MENNRYYTYVYLNPLKPGRFSYGDFVTFFYEPFYVGKGSGLRILVHANEKKPENNHRFNTIKIIKENNINMKDYIIKTIDYIDNDTSLEFEKKYIKIIGRHDKNLGPLTNHTDGGDGCIGEIRKGKPLSEKHKLSLCKAQKGKHKYYPNLEIKNKIGIKTKERWKNKTEEEKNVIKNKIRNTLKGRKLTEEHKENIRIKLLGRKITWNKKISESNKQRQIILRSLNGNTQCL